MIIPKYIQELMARSEYEYGRTYDEDYCVGYTIRVNKRSPYCRAETLKAEVEKFCKWADKVVGIPTTHILHIPTETKHANQFAVVTIYDPIMMTLEKYMPQDDKLQQLVALRKGDYVCE